MKISIETVVNATAQAAWNAYVDPEAVVHWNFASPDWCCPRAENDLRKGGRFSYRMEACDGSIGFDFGGTYTGVQPLESIHYVLGDGRTVSVEFHGVAGGIKVSVQFDAEQQNPPEMQRNGWHAILDNYRKFVETGSANA